jgi:hypothetical protein
MSAVELKVKLSPVLPPLLMPTMSATGVIGEYPQLMPTTISFSEEQR